MPFAILSFRLDTMADTGSLMQIIRQYVSNYYLDNHSALEYIGIPISFTDTSALAAHVAKVTEIVQDLERYVVRIYSIFFVLIIVR